MDGYVSQKRLTSGLQHFSRLPSSSDSSSACSLRLSKLALLLLDVHSPLSQLRWLCSQGRSSCRAMILVHQPLVPS